MVDLRSLVKDLGGHLETQAQASLDAQGADVLRVRLDSRQVQAGDLFVALEGSSQNGSRYALDALARGACAILSQAPLEPAWQREQTVPVWIHPRARAIAGHVAAQLLGHPSRGMFVVAVTGTNGKTTTAHLISQLMAACGKRSGVLGTSGNRLADGQLRPATHTTPDAPSLQEWVALHRSLGGDALALEASSHALDQERLAGLDVDVLPMIPRAVMEGGHVRVGLEDAPFGSDKSNLQWVEEAAQRIGNVGGELATARDVRAALAPEDQEMP